MARQQLRLIDSTPVWRLDERTKEVGRRGLAQARAALAAADQRRSEREAERRAEPGRRHPSAA